MLKHRGFPGRLPSTDHQFVIRRANAKGATPLVARERYRDRSPSDRRADVGFLAALIEHFGDEPFERGNLDAGRLSRRNGPTAFPAWVWSSAIVSSCPRLPPVFPLSTRRRSMTSSRPTCWTNIWRRR